MRYVFSAFYGDQSLRIKHHSQKITYFTLFWHIRIGEVYYHTVNISFLFDLCSVVLSIFWQQRWGPLLEWKPGAYRGRIQRRSRSKPGRNLRHQARRLRQGSGGREDRRSTTLLHLQELSRVQLDLRNAHEETNWTKTKKKYLYYFVEKWDYQMRKGRDSRLQNGKEDHQKEGVYIVTKAICLIKCYYSLYWKVSAGCNIKYFN